LARNGSSLKEIEDYVIQEFGYDLSETLDQMRARHRHDESSMDTLPKALKSFLEGESFEDVVRNAISLGGDTDTIAAIAGAMADAFFGIPEEYKKVSRKSLDIEMMEVIGKFDDKLDGIII
jgi:type I restriction enzyme M protein